MYFIVALCFVIQAYGFLNVIDSGKFLNNCGYFAISLTILMFFL